MESVPTVQTGGRGGIRTHGEFNPTLDFESSALNRTQPPFLLLFQTTFDLAREWKPAQGAVTAQGKAGDSVMPDKAGGINDRLCPTQKRKNVTNFVLLARCFPLHVVGPLVLLRY